MGTARTIDTEIAKYLPRLSKRQKETLLTVARTFAEEKAAEDYDEAFIAKMDERFAQMKAGKLKTYSLEEVKASAQKAYRNQKKKA